jgi:haloalkane dehalogenase
MNDISPRMPYEKATAEVNGQKMAYAEHGTGDPIVFLHGNATSSYMWRNIMPHLEGRGRLIAIDNIG